MLNIKPSRKDMQSHFGQINKDIMKRNHTQKSLILTMPLIFLLSGCSFFQKLIFTIDNSVVLGEPKSMEDCTDFIGDVSTDCQAYLEAKENCEKGDYERVVIPLDFRDTQWGKALQKTCDDKEKAEKDMAKKAQYEAVDKGNEAMKSSSCEELQNNWNLHSSAITDDYYATKEGSIKNFVAAGQRFAECEKWDFLFTHLMHWGGPNEHGPQLIATLAEDGVDIESKMLAFLKTSPMNFEYSQTASQHYTDFLNQKKMFSNCSKYIRASTKMPGLAWEQFSYFFQQSNCKAAANSVKNRLSSELPEVRIMACRTLAKIGSRRHLKKMRSVAKSDSYYKEIELIKDGKLYLEKEYTVRDICAESAEQLRTR